jgi:signal transduction histidine kinase
MGWRDRVGLRARVFSVLAAVLLVTIAGGAVMIWYTYQMEDLVGEVMERDVAALERAEDLALELSMQKGYVSYYFMTGDEKWLAELEAQRRKFAEVLGRVREGASEEKEKAILSELEREYQEYIQAKDKVIALYKQGKRERGAALHVEVRATFFRILDLCSEFKALHQMKIQSLLARSRSEARQLRLIAGAAMSAALALGLLWSFILVAQILDPIRRLTWETVSQEGLPAPRNEISELEIRVHGLIRDADSTKVELAKSRERLFQSEKMAVVGKLAADVAHSIRNPMTSIKMRLFSLERSLELSPNQKEDFAVVAEEMRRLDNIVRNFLEFSRPPKLKKQPVDLAAVLDMALQLLQHRLELHGVDLDKRYGRPLPVIEADPELLKEVVVNFVVNACEAMREGGRLIIAEEEKVVEGLGGSVVVRISDTGPGIPPALQEKIFEPFFSTKEDGTGLGLSIALRIIEEHGGRLTMESREGEGATFIIALPIRGNEHYS